MMAAEARRTRRRQREEEMIQRALVTLLEVAARPGVAWTHVPSGERRDPLAGAILKGMGHRPGWPDLVFVKAGRFFGLELKKPGGRLSDSQRTAQAALADAGAVVETAYSVDEAIAILKRWEIIR